MKYYNFLMRKAKWGIIQKVTISYYIVNFRTRVQIFSTMQIY